MKADDPAHAPNQTSPHPSLTLPGEINRWQSIVLAFMVLSGIVASFAVPVGGGFDEIQHLRRAWEMSAFEFIPNSRLGPEMPVPSIFRELSYREQPIVRAVGPGYWGEYGDLPLDSRGWTSRRVSTRSIYSPPLLLPQSLILRYMGRKYDLPFLWTLAVMRISGLLVYSALAYLSVRLIPFGKWPMLVLAALPTSLFLASTVTADTISNGLALLFVGGALRVSMRDRIDRQGAAMLIILSALLFLAKPNLVPLALLPFVLARPSRFAGRALYGLTVAAILGLLALEFVGWNLLAYPREGVMISPAAPADHLASFLEQPFWVVGALLKDLLANGADYFLGWMAAYGYYYWPPPTLSILLVLTAIVLSLFSSEDGGLIERRTRLALLATWIVAYATTALMLQIINVDPGTGEVREIQGRYLTGAMPLLVLALTGLRLPRVHSRSWLVGSATILGLGTYVAGLVLAYHVSCGTRYYEPGVCLIPRYKNWAPWDHPTPPISHPIVLRQEILVECDGLSELRLWVNSEKAADGATRFQLRHRMAPGPVLDEQIANWELPQGEWVRLGFERQPQSEGEVYILLVRGEGVGQEGVTLGMTVRPEYEAGQLYLGGEEVGQDLFFQYGCSTGFSFPLIK